MKSLFWWFLLAQGAIMWSMSFTGNEKKLVFHPNFKIPDQRIISEVSFDPSLSLNGLSTAAKMPWKRSPVDFYCSLHCTEKEKKILSSAPTHCKHVRGIKAKTEPPGYVPNEEGLNVPCDGLFIRSKRSETKSCLKRSKNIFKYTCIALASCQHQKLLKLLNYT